MSIASLSARRGVASLGIGGEIVMKNRVTDVGIIERGEESCLELAFHLSCTAVFGAIVFMIIDTITRLF